MKIKIRFFILPLLMASNMARADSLCPPSVPEDICQAEQQIYIHTDFQKTEDVRNAMVNLKKIMMLHDRDSEAVRDHILSLVDHVVDKANVVRLPRNIINSVVGKENLFTVLAQLRDWEEKNGAILPLDWDFPHEILSIVASNRREFDPAQDRTKFEISLFGVLRQDVAFEQVQLIRYPNEVILDKQAGIGHWNANHGDTSRPATFSLNLDGLGEAAKTGLYLINIKAQNQPMTKGWFIMSRTQATTAPVVQSPRLNEVFHTDQPTFQWTDFKSSDYRPMEQRKRKIHVHEANTDAGRWFFFEVYADHSQEATIGDPKAQGIKRLGNGNYSFEIGFEERWFFGGFLIGRESATQIPFSVLK